MPKVRTYLSVLEGALSTFDDEVVLPLEDGSVVVRLWDVCCEEAAGATSSLALLLNSGADGR